MLATRLRTEHMRDPIGLETVQPMLSWNTDGGVQSAYRIIASVDGQKVWDSGKVQSSALLTRCGYTAAPAQQVQWKIRLWDAEDQAGDWSEARFETGLTEPSLWQAQWIETEPQDGDGTGTETGTGIEGAGKRQPAACLRRQFYAEQTENARLYITCHGLYVACLNGERVGDFVLAPGTDDYRKRLQVQTYDVSGLLRTGMNEIRVVLGDGWYRGNVGVDGLQNYFGSDQALLCQLEAGGKTVLCSDGNWEASSRGPIRLNDLEIGEVYDARLEGIWTAEGGWYRVHTAAFGYDVLCGSDSVPVKEQERFPGQLIRTPDGSAVVDFGQNLAGYTELRVTARAGQTITLLHGETLDENGNFTQSNFDPGDRNKNGGIPQKIVYTCKEGLNVYKPSFSIFGFRYVKVETDIDLTDAAFTAIAVYSEMEQTGTFRCGNEDVNRLFLNSLWSMKSNFCDVPTDCPTRERAGWTGDAGAFAPTGVMLADCYPVLRKWLADLRIAQKEDGLVPNIAPPNYGDSRISAMLQGSAGWGDACILVPWALYEAYGDPSILEENYEMMRRWLDFTARRAQKTRIHNMGNPWKKYLADQGFHFGEWLEPDVSSMDVMKKTMMFGAPEVATAYYYRSADLLSRIAEVLGKTDDAQQYAELAANVRKAYRHTCTKKGEIRSERQAEYVRPIAFGLLDKEEIPKAAWQLHALVERSGWQLNTGFLSTPLLCGVLADNGYTETAYRLLLQDKCPSWLYAVKKGATTIWETWDGIREDGTVHDSFNHYSYGAISGWLLQGVCGIRLQAGKLRICPRPDRSLGHAEGTWQSPVGRIESSWRYEDDRIRFRLRLPVPAVIELPDGRTYDADAGEVQDEVLL